MTTFASNIPFDVDLERLLPAGAMDSMSPAEVGVAYRTLRLAWSRNGSVPADLHTLIRSARLLEADLVHVQGLITLAGQPEADGRAITFPILRDVLTRTREDLARRSRAGRAGANARWRGGEPPPDPGLGLRLMRSECDRIAVASDALSNSESSSGARRSSELSANPSAQTGARKSCSQEKWAPSAGLNAPWAIDLAKLTPEQAASEQARRSAVHVQVHRVRFPGAVKDKEFLPGRTSEAITLAPWVTEELAAFAVWEARKTVAEFARRTPPEAFNPIGLVIAITGTTRDHPGRVRQVSLFFHQEWERRLEAQRRQAEATAAVNSKFIADVKSQQAGGGA